MNAALTRPMSARDWGLLLVLSVLWGGSFLFIKMAVVDIAPLVLVLGRVALAALTLMGVLWLRGMALPRGQTLWLQFLAMGMLNNVIPFSLIFWGQQFVAAGVGAILNASTPFFAVMTAHMLSDDKATPAKLTGVITGFFGVLVMIGPAVFSGGGSVWPYLAFLGAGFSYSLSSLYGRRFKAMGISPLESAFGQLTASSAVMLPVALLFHGAFWMQPVSAQSLAVLLALAVFSTALAYVIFFQVLGSAGATNVQLVTLLVPVSAIVLGALVLQERLAPQHFLGMAIIAAGLLIIDGRMVTRWQRA